MKNTTTTLPNRHLIEFYLALHFLDRHIAGMNPITHGEAIAEMAYVFGLSLEELNMTYPSGHNRFIALVGFAKDNLRRHQMIKQVSWNQWTITELGIRKASVLQSIRNASNLLSGNQ